MKIPKILIIEDNLINLKLCQAYLNSYQIEFLTARNGSEGLELARNNSDIDLILMNYMMPVMDGMESTFEIRKFNKTVPIIMMSAAIVSAGDLLNKSIEVGCDDYLSIPFRLTIFVQKIQEYLGYDLIKK